MCDFASFASEPQCIAYAALSRSLRPVPARGVTHRHLRLIGLLDLLRLLDLLHIGLPRLGLRHLHSACVHGTAIATQRNKAFRMTARRSQCDGDRIHPVWEEGHPVCPAPQLQPPSWPPSWPAKPERKMQNCKARARGHPHADIWGSENVGKKSFAIIGASHARRNLVRGMGPECRCAARNATATRVGARACGAWGVQPRRAARRRPQRSPRVCGA
jgi:hypothetical protein